MSYLTNYANLVVDTLDCNNLKSVNLDLNTNVNSFTVGSAQTSNANDLITEGIGKSFVYEDKPSFVGSFDTGRAVIIKEGEENYQASPLVYNAGTQTASFNDGVKNYIGRIGITSTVDPPNSSTPVQFLTSVIDVRVESNAQPVSMFFGPVQFLQATNANLGSVQWTSTVLTDPYGVVIDPSNNTKIRNNQTRTLNLYVAWNIVWQGYVPKAQQWSSYSPTIWLAKYDSSGNEIENMGIRGREMQNRDSPAAVWKTYGDSHAMGLGAGISLGVGQSISIRYQFATNGFPDNQGIRTRIGDNSNYKGYWIDDAGNIWQPSNPNRGNVYNSGASSRLTIARLN